MIDTKELRLIVHDYRLAGSPVFIQTADMDEILNRLEAAEKAVTEAYQRGYATGQEEIEAERDALRAEVKDRNEVITLLQNELRTYKEREKTMGWNNG